MTIVGLEHGHRNAQHLTWCFGHDVREGWVAAHQDDFTECVSRLEAADELRLAAIAGNGGDQFAVEQNPQRGGVLSIFDHHLFRLVRHDSRLLHEPREKVVAKVLAEADALFFRNATTRSFFMMLRPNQTPAVGAVAGRAGAAYHWSFGTIFGSFGRSRSWAT